MNIIMVFICIHWGFATGGLMALKTNWSIPRFIILLLLIKYFLLNYGI
jgi:hypothetical protein